MGELHTVKTNRKLMLAAVLLLFLISPYFTQAAQAVWQGASAVSVRHHYRYWPALESKHFHLRYSEADRDLAEWLGREADHAALQVANILPHNMDQSRPWLVVVPDQETLKRVFGWSDATGALGVYVADTVKILSPAAWEWREPEKRQALFSKQGPLVHEYTHYVLDLRTNGNYTRWFSEGLAQLLEYHILGYEWLEAHSSLAAPHYSLEELDRSFDNLPHEALVYRQSLCMVTFLESKGGTEKLNELIDTLGDGVSFYAALEQVYGLNKADFFNEWQQWYPQDSRWFMTR
ncbi:MAG: hypothetical protein SCK29_14080 [Bacillota bacterium]|nr:hypothetical protein [Bacillota bacterium]MDW7685230.1 hypothetical protein [Bacillota bacterium]